MAHDVIGYLELDPLPDASGDAVFEDYLLFVRDNLCDARHRSKWWLQRKHQYKQDGDHKLGQRVSGKAGALGRLLSDILHLRHQIADANEKNAQQVPPIEPVFPGVTELHAKTLGEAIKADKTMPELQPDQRGIGNFLSGNPAGPNDDWMRYGRRLLCLAIAGTAENPKRGMTVEKSSSRPSPAKNAATERFEWPELEQICKYFFPDKGPTSAPMDALEFFDESLRDAASECTTVESIATIWRTTRLARCKTNGTQCIVRTSAGNRFQHTSIGGRALLPSGDATLDALAAGVRVIFVHPAKNHAHVIETDAMRKRGSTPIVDAEESVHEFLKASLQACAKKELDPRTVLSRVHWLVIDPVGDAPTPAPDSDVPWVCPQIVRSPQVPPLFLAAFLTPLARHVAHGELKFGKDGCEGFTPRVLLSRRLAPEGLIVPNANGHEQRLFGEWFKRVAAPCITCAEPAAP
jgi:hypothetical protein